MPGQTTQAEQAEQERVDALSRIAVAGSTSDNDSSDDEIDLEDAAITARRRLTAFMNADGPWTPYSRRQSTAGQAIRDFDRDFEQRRDPSPSRRHTR